MSGGEDRAVRKSSSSTKSSRATTGPRAAAAREAEPARGQQGVGTPGQALGAMDARQQRASTREERGSGHGGRRASAGGCLWLEDARKKGIKGEVKGSSQGSRRGVQLARGGARGRESTKIAAATVGARG